MQRRFHGDERLRFFLGDVRDLRAPQAGDARRRRRRPRGGAEAGPACEYNPFEAVQTNVLGAENMVDAAIDNDVPQTIAAVSTDKAVNPVNLYGATKLCAEKIIAQGNAYAGGTRRPLRVRPLRQRRRQPRQRHPAVQAAGERRRADDHRRGDDALLDHPRAGGRLRRSTASAGCTAARSSCPKIPSMRVTDIAEALAPDATRKMIGIRPGREAPRGPDHRGRGPPRRSLRRLLRDLSPISVLAHRALPRGRRARTRLSLLERLERRSG